MSKYHQNLSRRDFIQLAGFGLMMPVLDGCAGSAANRRENGIPRTGFADSYSATVVQSVNIHGSQVRVLYPRRPLGESRSYSRGFLEGETTENGVYRYAALIPGVSFGNEDAGTVPCSQEMINAGRCSVLGENLRRSITHSSNVAIEYSIRRAGQDLSLYFAQSLDTEGRPGARGVDAREFAALVRRVSGRDIRRMEILLEVNNILINAHAIPVDERGQIISGYDIGVLALGLSFHPDVRDFYSGISLLVEQR
jgi:hypothetical protein